jgi:hypothetical protein
VMNSWRYQDALPHSESLRRAVRRLQSFRPTWVRQ